MPSPALEILSGDLAGRCYDVDGDRFTIGRRDDCDLVLPKRYVSRVHAEVVRGDEGGFVLKGISDKNPILVKGREVARHGLRDGDEFDLCGIKIRFLAKGKAKSGSGMGRDGPREKHRFDSEPEGDVAKQRSGSGTGSIGDDETAPPGPDESSAPPERIVFGEESNPKGAALDSKASGGSGTGAIAKGESGASGDGDAKQSDEKTDAIDVTKLRKNDDPFADDEEEEQGKDPAVAAARERFLRALVFAGILGIVFAIAFIGRNYATKPPPTTFTKEISVAPGETKLIEEPWPAEDPPLGRQWTDKTGAPYVYGENDVIRVEWAIPDLDRKALFLVSGKRPGEASFALKYSKSENTLEIKVVVKGDDPHEALRGERKKKLEALAIVDLKAEIKRRYDGGSTLFTARETPGKEDYYKRAVNELERGKECVDALGAAVDRNGIPDPDLEQLRTNVDKLLADAKQQFDTFLTLQRSKYEGMVKRNEKKEARGQLAILMRTLSDPCGFDFKRYQLIHEHVWKGRFSEVVNCIEKAP